MRGRLNRKGYYQLFDSQNGHSILKLDSDEYYLILSGNQYDIVVRTKVNSDQGKFYENGTYYIADFKEDEFDGIPHLFLESSAAHRELLFPNGIPDEDNEGKEFTHSKEDVGFSHIPRSK